MRLTILGPPITHKNSGQIIGSGPRCGKCGCRTGRPFLIPSKPYQAWEKEAIRQLKRQLAVSTASCPVSVPVNCRALIYRERAVGDAVNFYQSVGDALERGGVVEKDRLIVSWDGSRLLKDDANPRVEILLSPVDDAAYSAVRTWRPRASQVALPLPKPSPFEDADVPIR